MTPPAGRAEHRFLRPVVFFPALLLLVVFSVLLTPHRTTDNAGTLTTHSSSPAGARGLMEIAQRFGWNTRRLEEPLSSALSPDAIYAVLVPGVQLTESETHILLDRVRAGASLLVLLGGGPLRDSLHLDIDDSEGILAHRGDSVACPRQPVTIRSFETRVPFLASEVERTGPVPGDTISLAVTSRRRKTGSRTAIMGLTFGRGRIAAVAESRILANEALRVCTWPAGIAAVRTLDWLAEREGDAPRREIIFDEFHHGYGNHASVVRTMQRWAARTPSGRTTLQIVIAGVILLLAAGARPIAPIPARTIARRSPLEHVMALAHAYERVRGTRTGTRLLVKGVRRRANRPVGTHTVSEESFLDGIAARTPSLGADVSRVKSAMAREIPAAEFLEIASLIDRIERSVRS